MAFTLSRCTVGKKKKAPSVPVKAVKKKTKVRANTSKKDGPRQPSPSQTKRKQRRILPVRCFRPDKYSDLERMEKEFLGENTTDGSSSSDIENENDDHHHQDADNNNINSSQAPQTDASSGTRKAPPIPSFQQLHLSDLESSDDEQDVFLLSLPVFKKSSSSSKEKGGKHNKVKEQRRSFQKSSQNNTQTIASLSQPKKNVNATTQTLDEDNESSDNNVSKNKPEGTRPLHQKPPTKKFVATACSPIREETSFDIEDDSEFATFDDNDDEQEAATVAVPPNNDNDDDAATLNNDDDDDDDGRDESSAGNRNTSLEEKKTAVAVATPVVPDNSSETTPHDSSSPSATTADACTPSGQSLNAKNDSDASSVNNHEDDQGKDSKNTNNAQQKRKDSTDNTTDNNKKQTKKKPSKSKKSQPDDRSLFVELDRLFLASDEDDVSIKAFFKSLETRLGTKLDRQTKQKVRTRLTDLVNGVIRPTVSDETGRELTGEDRSPKTSDDDSRPDNSLLGDSTGIERSTKPLNGPQNCTTNIGPSNGEAVVEEAIKDSKLSLDSQTKDHASTSTTCTSTSADIFENTQETSSENVRASSEPRSGSVPTTSDPTIEMGTPDEPCNQYSQNTSTALEAMLLLGSPGSKSKKPVENAEKSHPTLENIVEAISLVEEPTEKTSSKLDKRHTNEQKGRTNAPVSNSTSPGKLAETGGKNDCPVTNEDVTNKDIREIPLKKKRKQNKETAAAKSSDKHGNIRVGVNGNDEDYCQIVQPSEVPPKEAPKKPRKRGRQTKETKHSSVGEETTKVDEPLRSTKSTVDTSNPRPRKRAKKTGKCALCTTCPCQKSQDVSNGAVLDMKTFARSEAAVEKALIRRVQKLEKSSEALEEQAELVKRKLKNHRREILKKKHKKLALKLDSQSRFLPDAEEFEAYQRKSTTVPTAIVKEAQKRMFPNVKDGQPTLTQLMGCPSKTTKEPMPDKNVMAPVDEASLGNDDSDKPSSEAMEEEDPSSGFDEDESVEYVQEPEYVENHSVITWKRGEDNATKKASTNLACASLWGMLSTIPEETDADLKASDPSSLANKDQTFISSWDAQFTENVEKTQSSQDEEEGLDCLFGLFEEPASPPGLTQPKTQDSTSLDQNVSMSMLSQEAQDLASNFCSSIVMDEARASSLERACPNWKENVAFSFLQKDKGDLTAAIENVKKSRTRMLERKRKLLEAWDRQNMVLEVYESALSTSLNRMQSTRVGDKPSEPCTKDVLKGGFLTATSHENVDVDEIKQPDDEGDGLGHERSAPQLLEAS